MKQKSRIHHPCGGGASSGEDAYGFNPYTDCIEIDLYKVISNNLKLKSKLRSILGKDFKGFLKDIKDYGKEYYHPNERGYDYNFHINYYDYLDGDAYDIIVDYLKKNIEDVMTEVSETLNDFYYKMYDPDTYIKDLKDCKFDEDLDIIW